MADKKEMETVSKPFLKGAPADENTFRACVRIFGLLVLVMFMTFIVCSMTSFRSVILRVLINMVIESLILLVFFSKGAEIGTDAVARGEILFQHIQRGVEVSEGEKRIPFHHLKGFVIGVGGTAVFFLLAVFLAATAQKQLTSAGTLPSWMEPYMRRTEISGSLAAYTQSSGFSLTDIVRIVIRMMIMPFISIAGADNREALLVLERLSPLLVLLPGLSYGAGYLQGPVRRRKVHSEIAQNTRKRISREKRERKARKIQIPRGPEQLN